MDGSKAFLREATDDDASVILRVLHTAFEEYRGHLDPPSGVHSETVETIRGKLRVGGAVLAVVDGTVAGCVFYQPEGSHLYLSRLAVLPQYRDQGLGRALTQYVERRAQEVNLQRVQLGLRLVLADLRAYYERLGYHFVRQGAHEGYAAPTYVVLEKQV